MADEKPEGAVKVDADALRKVEEESEPKANPRPRAPLEDSGAPGGTAGTDGTRNDRDG